MTRTILLISLGFVLCSECRVGAQEPPPPSQVAATVSNLWGAQDFTGLASYVTALHVSHPNYIPAILASAFHDVIYLGRFPDAIGKLTRVQQYALANPNGITKEFTDFLGELQSDTVREKDLHANKGTTPEMLSANASPQRVRGTWGTTLPPQIGILQCAPAAIIP